MLVNNLVKGVTMKEVAEKLHNRVCSYVKKVFAGSCTVSRFYDYWAEKLLYSTKYLLDKTFAVFTPYPQMVFRELSVEQYNLIEMMVTTAKIFSANATKVK